MPPDTHPQHPPAVHAPIAPSVARVDTAPASQADAAVTFVSRFVPETEDLTTLVHTTGSAAAGSAEEASAVIARRSVRMARLRVGSGECVDLISVPLL